MEENVISVRKFGHAFRFKDDLISINNGDFEKNIRNIYPAAFEHKKNQMNNITNFSHTKF